MNSHAIDEVVRIGPRVVPILITFMERKDLDFDAFCKYYSTCDQIFRAKSPKMKTVWYGGASTERVPGKGSRLVPKGGIDYAEFRKHVVDSIKWNYRLVSESKN